MNKRMHEKIEKFRIRERVDSDYMIVKVMIEEDKGREKEQDKRRQEGDGTKKQ